MLTINIFLVGELNYYIFFTFVITKPRITRRTRHILILKLLGAYKNMG